MQVHFFFLVIPLLGLQKGAWPVFLYITLCKSCYCISFTTICLRDFIMVQYCWPGCAYASLVGFFLPGAQRGAWSVFPYKTLCKSCYRISSETNCLQDSIIVQYCWLSGLVMHVQFWLGSSFQGPRKGRGQFSLYNYVNLVIASPPRLFVSES